ncbi:MAG: nitroreductase family protein [Rickettsiales bacterium]|jgi:nitroreductase|nr:nitroreductase family protein [Rickettsiales bacterium]
MGPETIDIIHRRRSIRQFRDTPLSAEDIHTILSAGMTAPSAMNKQPWRLILISDDEKKEKIAGIAMYAQMIRQSPLAVLACYDERVAFQNYGIVDTAACIENMLLAATALGIGSVWTGVGADEILEYRKLLGLPEQVVPLGLVIFGYSDTAFEVRDYFDGKKIHSNEW